MPGFCISNLEHDVPMLNTGVETYIYGKEEVDGYVVKRATLNKFVQDKTLHQDGHCLYVLEGVVLNKCSLYAEYQVHSIEDLLAAMYREAGECFFEQFRGSFSGAVYDKEKRAWIVFTNHYGDNIVYYYHQGKRLVLGSQMNYLLDALQANGCVYHLDERAVHAMLTYGFMSDDFTYAREIKRLLPGHYMKITEDGVSVKQYYRIRQDAYDLKGKAEGEIVEEMDRLFREAVRLEYEKDREYGYRHLTQLSGGLDSRMNLWVAQDMGYEDILCMTFAQSGCTDELVAKEIAAYLGRELLVWPLDNARHMMKVDEYVAMNYGTAIYSGIGAEGEILHTMNMERFGLVHTGQMGDVIAGCFLKDAAEWSDMSVGGVYSHRIIDANEKISEIKFGNREEYLLFIRGYMGCLSSHLYTRNYTEVASPFLNIEFYEYCLSIPLDLRIDHRIYKKWILRKYPKAADFIWEKLGRKITEKEKKNYARRLWAAVKNPKLFLWKLGFHVDLGEGTFTGMNPMDLWWEENAILRKYVEGYYAREIERGILSEEARKDLELLYQEGTLSEKAQVLTVLGAVRYYFSRDKDAGTL